ncbi:unnamed protein product, partial [Ranitomeya imitator]
MVVDDEEKANILNTFFSTVFTVENEMLDVMDSHQILMMEVTGGHQILMMEVTGGHQILMMEVTGGHQILMMEVTGGHQILMMEVTGGHQILMMEVTGGHQILMMEVTGGHQILMMEILMMEVTGGHQILMMEVTGGHQILMMEVTGGHQILMMEVTGGHQILMMEREGLGRFEHFLQDTQGIHIFHFWMDCEAFKEKSVDLEVSHSPEDARQLCVHLFRSLQNKYRSCLSLESEEQIRQCQQSRGASYHALRRPQYDALRRLRSYWIPRFLIHRQRRLQD